MAEGWELQRCQQITEQLEAEMAELVRVLVCTHMHIAGDIGPGVAYPRRYIEAPVWGRDQDGS